MSGNDIAVFKEQNGLQLAPEFMPLVQAGLTDDLSEGVGGGFAVISIKAGKFRVKHKGNEIPVMSERGDPVGSLDVVILRANAHITKQWYAKQYEDGDASSPDCFSIDGRIPSPGSPNIQATSCAACPKNIFGSAPARDGVASKAKACSDNRKLAVVPAEDMDNETFGGPMLFRVPPSALQELAQFGNAWKARGYPYNSIVVRIGMDMNVSHPKPTFTGVRPLTSEEAQRVLDMMHSPAVEKILNDFDGAPVAPAAAAGPAFADVQAETASRAAPAAQPAAKPAPPPTAAAQPSAAPAASTFGGKKPAAPAQAASQTAPAGQGATFGKAKVSQTPPGGAAPVTAAKPARAKAKAAAAPAPAPVAQTAAPAEAPEVVEDPTAAGGADADIEQILADLGAVAGQ